MHHFPLTASAFGFCASFAAGLRTETSHSKENASSALAKAKLDEEVGEILSRLKEIKSFDELADFRKIPLELKEKIDNNETLRQTIKNDVEGYYNYIRHVHKHVISKSREDIQTL